MSTVLSKAIKELQEYNNYGDFIAKSYRCQSARLHSKSDRLIWLYHWFGKRRVDKKTLITKKKASNFKKCLF